MGTEAEYAHPLSGSSSIREWIGNCQKRQIKKNQGAATICRPIAARQSPPARRSPLWIHLPYPRAFW